MTQKFDFNYNIRNFMLAELGLGGHELLVFAVIYSFTKANAGCFYGSQSYLARACGLSLSTVGRVLQKLVEKGCVEKCSYDKRIGYRSTKDAGDCRYDDVEAPPNDAELLLPSAERLEKLGLNALDIIDMNSPHPKYEFHNVGRHELVSMTAEQYSRLTKLVAPDKLAVYITKLELLIRDKGYRTFNSYKTIKKWIYEDTGV